MKDKEKILADIAPLGTLQALKQMCTDPLYEVYKSMHFRRGREEEIAPWNMVEIYEIARLLNSQANALVEGDSLSSQEGMKDFIKDRRLRIMNRFRVDSS